jgi:surface polysaccharide O-acyltransferase-like enzyme
MGALPLYSMFRASSHEIFGSNLRCGLCAACSLKDHHFVTLALGRAIVVRLIPVVNCSSKAMHLKSFEYFRAVTIVIIVLGHSYGIAGWEIDSFWDRALGNLISGGTSLFVFISGFLFHHVFYPRFHYSTFIKKKFKNVYVPYLILSFLPVCVSIYTRIPYEEFYFGLNDTIFDQIIRPALLHYWYGGVMTYWYIPFIMGMFLISPVFIRFIQLQTRTKILIIALTTCVSLFLHRPVNNWSIVQSIVYFSPVYMFGILCSMERDWIYEKFLHKDGWLFLFVLFLAILQAAVMRTSGNLQKPPLDFNGVDISLLQKMSLCVFFMVFLHRFENVDSRLLKQLAVSSFSIYFLHGWFIWFIWLARDWYIEVAGLHLLPVLSGLVIWISYLVALRIKSAFPDKSRMLIGW